MLIVGDGQDREVERGKLQCARFAVHDMEPERREQPKNRSGFGGARRVVIAGDHHDLRPRQRSAQPSELQVGVQDRRVRRPHLMEDISTDQHDLGRQLDHLVQRARERLRDVSFALIDPSGRQPLVLAKAKMKVGEMDEAQTRRNRDELTSCPEGSWPIPSARER